MSKAQVGHSALDAEAGIVGELAQRNTEDRVQFLNAAVVHAEQQRDILDDQYDRLSERWETIQTQWNGKLDEAERMRDEAEDTVEALSRELDALDG
jgi:predicted  nucleic acid-binding Zn-ribbon protein